MCLCYSLSRYLFIRIDWTGRGWLIIQFEYSLLKCRVKERHRDIGDVVVSVLLFYGYALVRWYGLVFFVILMSEMNMSHWYGWILAVASPWADWNVCRYWFKTIRLPFDQENVKLQENVHNYFKLAICILRNYILKLVL